MYSKQEKYDILQVYIKCNKNAALAQREYSQKYPERRLPPPITFIRIDTKLQQTGSLLNKKRTPVNRRQRINLVLRHFRENPQSSINDAARNLRYSFGFIHKVLKQNKFKPYKYRIVQKLSEPQIEYRFQFCSNVIERIRRNPNFLNKVLWTDFATFTTSGCCNRQNTRYWADQNPRRIRPIRKQGRTSIHVWCGIYHNRVIGPIFIDQHLNGQRYLQLLLGEINEYINQFPNNEEFIWQQDGAPPHNIHEVTQYLNQRYDEWFGKYGTTRWPANSPDLTPLDTFLWGHLKNNVYKDRHENILEIQNRIQHLVNEINNHPEIIENCLQNLDKRYRLCVEHQGRNFEQFL